MPLNAERARHHLAEFRLELLFVEELGWDRYSGHLDVALDGKTYRLRGVAEKRGMAAFIVENSDDGLPDSATRRKIERQAAKSVHEHLIVYADGARTTQVWQWVRREPGRPIACRELHYQRGQSGESLIQRLDAVTFTLDEEAELSIVDVTRRARAAFDIERVTRRFYDLFKTEHEAFLGFIRGLESQDDLEWYASVMLNRLMFVYFIQKKGFLDGDRDYLRHRLESVQADAGRDQFHSFYRHFLLRLFHEGLGQRRRSSDLDGLLGHVPYLNGGLFDVHELERENPDIQIPDEAFEQLFDFFDAYQWHLDDRPLRSDNEINPDVLGYIFEKYVNQKQMGAYYTKEDITDYITASTLIPRLLEKLAGTADDFDFVTIGELLAADPDRYIHDPLRHGNQNELPEEVAAGIDDPSQRGNWNAAAPSSHALPTETWREVVARRMHYGTIRAKLASGDVRNASDLVALNLDLEQLALDLIETCDSPALLGGIYRELESLSVLDPTCGSGAFLFAALNILELLYEAALERMAGFLADGNARETSANFAAITERVEHHPNRTFFVLKTIVVNNLYGVDIMEEAVEICKLRLFLRLVSQVGRHEDLEPLPDIDFNVRAGNSLVGFASLSELRRELGSKLDFDSSGQRIEDRSVDVDRAFQRFRDMQLADNVDDAELAGAKRELRKQLEGLRTELNVYLAAQYGRQPTDEDAYAQWLETHLPFHWLVEFHQIMSAGGFDVIVGNPPYVELSAVHGYELRGFRTMGAGNLYALTLERSLELKRDQGRLGFIVPVSSISTDRYAPLQNLLVRHELCCSSYDDRPSRLFEGLEHSRLTIHLVGTPVEQPVQFSTRYNKWSSVERPTLFPTLRYVRSEPSVVHNAIAKLSSPLEHSILQKMKERGGRLANAVTRTGRHEMYYSRKVGYFLQVLDFEPLVRDGNGRRRPPSEFKTLRFERENEATAALCVLNSNLFYWFVTIFSDCRHVNKREVDAFPVQVPGLANEFGAELARLRTELMQDIQVNSEIRSMNFRHDLLSVQFIYPRKSKPILDRIDAVLAGWYGFSGEELDFVTSYDFKYRVGVDNE